MAIQSVKYFSGTVELRSIWQMKNAIADTCFPELKVKRADGFTKYVGYENSSEDMVILPVTRIIEYKRNPSLHKCDARCQNAKGRTCECSCGGKFHGHNS